MIPDDNCPVIEASSSDAQSYAKWVGNRLPTETEWEHSIQGRLIRKRVAHGNELKDAGA